MSRIRFVQLLSVVVLTLGAHDVLGSTSITYSVGSCRSGPNNYKTIQAALNATPPPTFVLVCPGTYQEQVEITQSVTLEGISSGNSDQAIIAPPKGGLTLNARNDLGVSLAAQLWVNNSSGPVHIMNLTVDGMGSGLSTGYIVGIFYQNSAGSLNHATTRNQAGTGQGYGVWLEGGSSNPSVTLINSSIHDFDQDGIVAETNSTSSEITATLKNNDVTSPQSLKPNTGIFLENGSTVTATDNFVSIGGNGYGFQTGAGAAGSVSGNIVMNTWQGVAAGADGVSITSNRVFNSDYGIYLSSSIVQISSNKITNASIGIEFNCNADNNVKSNTIADASTGVDLVTGGVTTTNTYFNVATIEPAALCSF
jgi:hypothetical protein